MDVAITEFEEIDPSEVHLVKRGANGFPPLLAKQVAEEIAAAEAGEDLAEKAASGDCQTCDGSGKIRDGHMECPDCDGSGDASKATLSDKERAGMDESDFAYVDDKGGKHLPIQDAAHVRAALARFGQTQFDSADDKKAAAKKVLAAAKKFGIDVSGDADVSEAAKAVGDDVPADDGIPGSQSWEAADAARLSAATQSLLDLQQLLQTAAEREQVEGQTVDPDDLSQAWTLSDACYMLQNLLGVIAAMAATEQRESDMADDDDEMAEKAGKRNSAKDMAALRAARDHLNNVLGDEGTTTDGEDAAEKAMEEILAMPNATEILVQAVADGVAAAFKARDEAKAAVDAAVSDEEVAEKEAADAAEQEAVKAAQEAAKAEQDEATAAAVAAKVEEALKGITEKVQTLSADFQTVTADLDQVKKMATPGGPARTRAPQDLAKASERDTLEMEAIKFENLARTLVGDPEMKKGYEAKAAEVRQKIAAL